MPIEELTLNTARGCGYKTVQGFRDAWYERHPRSPMASVVWFALGDWRDLDTFLAWSGRRAGSDEKGYTRSRSQAMDADAPVPDEIVSIFAIANRQKDDARKATDSRNMATESASERLLRLERAADRIGAEAHQAIRQHLRVIEQRVVRAEKRPSEHERERYLPDE